MLFHKQATQTLEIFFFLMFTTGDVCWADVLKVIIKYKHLY